MTFDELVYSIETYESYMWNAKDFKITHEEALRIAEIFIYDIWREKIYGSSIGEKLAYIRKTPNIPKIVGRKYVQ